jgi:outer membrane receptor protein involved in Fe transport
MKTYPVSAQANLLTSRSRPPRQQAFRPLRFLLTGMAGFALWWCAPFAFAAGGQVTGKIVDAKSGKALGYANVAIVGTTLGGFSQEDGTYVIANVPEGPQDVQVTFIGYEGQHKQVKVEADKTTTVDFRLKEVVVKTEKEVLIQAQRPLVDVKKASTTRVYDEGELKALTIEPTLDSVIEQQPGVTKDNNQIHIRGGRSDETLYIVDGVQMRDLLTGDSRGGNISARSVAEVSIITGGFDAKYGQALSGVVEAKTKEGTEQYQGFIGYQTDHVVGNQQSDIMEFQIGGPLPLVPALLRPLGTHEQGRPTFFVDLGMNFEDGYLPGIADVPGAHLRSSYRDAFFGLTHRYDRSFYPRAANDWRLLFKTAWKASASHKFTLSLNKTLSFDQGFNDSDPSEINRNVNHYPWNYEGGFDRYYTVTHDQNSLALTWIHSVTPQLVDNVRFTRYFSSDHQDVAGKWWYQYNIVTTDSLASGDRPYFKDQGDATGYRDQYIETLSLDSDWVLKWHKHDVRWGARGQYETVQYLNLDASSVSAARPLGKQFDLFKVYPTTGAFYLQDRVEHEGLVASYGLRYDYWFPGAQVERLYRNQDHLTFNAETAREWQNATHDFFGRRYKGHLSPRIQVSHPITERDHLFFNYGQFTQRPPYFYVYAKSSSQSSEEFPRIGNPNLNPEISVQYELGAGHQIRPELAAKISIFQKDIYDYPTTATVELKDRTTTRSSYFVYFNRDYARSRGVELELRRRVGGRSSWATAYSYTVVKGKGSDPNRLALIRSTGGDARETSLDEEFMWWNRPHKLTFWYDYRVAANEKDARFFAFRVPADWSLNLFYSIETGRAYTPLDAFGTPTGPDYSKNGPLETKCNGTLTKGFRMGGHRVELTLQAWNIFNYRSALVLDPMTGQLYKIGQGSLRYSNTSPQYLINQYSDPSQRSAPRNIRLGFGVDL